MSLAILGLGVALSLPLAGVEWLLGVTVPAGAGTGLGMVPPLLAGHVLASRQGRPLPSGYRWSVSLWSVLLQLAMGAVVMVGFSIMLGLDPLALLPGPSLLLAAVGVAILAFAMAMTWLALYLGERLAIKAQEKAGQRSVPRRG